MDFEELIRRFTSHPTSLEQQSVMLSIRADAAALAELIVNKTPGSREQSLAITALEEAVFWANAAIARRS